MKDEFNVNVKTTDTAAGTHVAADNTLVPSVRGKDGTGYDIFSQVLNDTRTILVQGEVEPGMAGVIIAELKYLEHLDPDKEIQMIVNSPGGSIVDGLAIYDVMRQVSCPIVTTGIGMQASMGSVILAGGDTRVMAPNAQLLVHQGSGGSERADPSNLEIGRAFHQTLVDKLTTIYQDHTGLTKEYWNIVLNRDTWFTAEQAQEIGFIHGIVKAPEAKSAPYAADRATSPVDALAKHRDELAAQYDTVEKIRLAINTDAGDSDLARLRPQLAAKLAQFPEFWTEGKKKEMAATAKAGNVVKMTQKAAPGL